MHTNLKRPVSVSFTRYIFTEKFCVHVTTVYQCVSNLQSDPWPKGATPPRLQVELTEGYLWCPLTWSWCPYISRHSSVYKLLSYFENGCDVSMYYESGRTERWALFSGPRKIMCVTSKKAQLKCWRACRDAFWRHVHSQSEMKFSGPRVCHRKKMLNSNFGTSTGVANP